MKARAIPRPLRGWHETGCVVCGRPLVYSGRTQERECCVCHRVLPSDAVCEAGHFVCDDCHSGGGAALLAFLQDSRERDPVKLFLNACALPGVHMHGPEHHGIVPCVLLTACANCGPGRGLGARQAPARRLLRGAGRLRRGALLGLCRRRELRLHHLRKKLRPRPHEGAPGALSAETARRFVPRGFSLALCVPLWDRSYTRRHGEWLGKGKCRPSGGIFD